MSIKKIFSVLAFAMIVIFSTNIFSINAYAEKNNIFDIAKMNGPYCSKNYSLIDLGDTYEIKSFYIDVSRYTYSDRARLNFYDSNKKHVGSSEWLILNSSTSLKESANVDFKSVRYMNFSGNCVVKDLKIYGESFIDGITDLEAKTNHNSINLSWKNPVSNQVSKVNLYMNDKFLTSFDLKENITSHVVGNLEPGTKYKFTFSIADVNGNELKVGTVVKDFTTGIPVLDPPKVSVTPQDRSLIITWNDVKSPFLKGYNLYIDGNKIGSLLKDSKLNLKELENDKKYSVEVSAVNIDGVEGEKSKVVYGTPFADALIIEYDVEAPFTANDLLEILVGILSFIGPIILLVGALLWFKPLKRLLEKVVKKGLKK